MRRYEIKDLGDLTWFLGIRIIRDRENRKLRAELLLSFGTAPCGTPPKPYSAELL